MWVKNKQSGFTIVELLIVVVVIAILAAITIVSFSGIQKKAQLASLQSGTRTTINKVELFRVDNNLYPGSIVDCPSPAAINICLTPSSGESYAYTSNVPGGSGYRIDLVPSYELTLMGSGQFLYTSSAEKTGSSEFMQYMDLAPIIDRYGLKKYQLSFDIKSANAATSSVVLVYFQNGSTARYSGLQTDVNVTTSYSHHVVTFTPALSNNSDVASMLAFYGNYSSGNIPTVKNLQIQLAP
jgi:prepilin-type N-terminal cleavage/methylation domain-containing protein